MSDVLMDFSTNDILVQDGLLQLAVAEVAIEQNLQQALQLWYGEWFLDTKRGIPFKQHFFVKNPNLDLIQADLIGTSMAIRGVTQVTDYNVDFDSTRRALSVSMDAQTSNGQTISAQAQVTTQVNLSIQGTTR